MAKDKIKASTNCADCGKLLFSNKIGVFVCDCGWVGFTNENLATLSEKRKETLIKRYTKRTSTTPRAIPPSIAPPPPGSVQPPLNDYQTVLNLLRNDPRPGFGWRIKDIENRAGIKSCRTVLARLFRAGEIIRVKQGCYTIAPSGATAPSKETDESPSFPCEHCDEVFDTKALRHNHTLTEHYKKEGIPNKQERVLDWFNKNPPLDETGWKVPEVASRMKIERYNVTSVCCKLTMQGVMKRVGYGRYALTGKVLKPTAKAPEKPPEPKHMPSPYKVHKTEDGKICIVCKGHYELPKGLVKGLCPFRDHPWLPDPEAFICAECCVSLLNKLVSHSANAFYKEWDWQGLNLENPGEIFDGIHCIGNSNCPDPQDCPNLDECMEKIIIKRVRL